MKLPLLLLLAACCGAVAGGCESDLKLSLDGLRCSADLRCADGYACDTSSRVCVKKGAGDAGVSLPREAGAPQSPTGGAGSGEGGAAGNGGNAGVGGNGGVGGQVAGAAGVGVELDAGLSDPDAGDGCVPVTVYRDRDGDGFGDVDRSRTACPGGGWVLDGTDCRDDIPEVNPGQTGFFGEGYAAAGGGVSFDYDCSSSEEPSPSNDTNEPAPDCAGLSLGGCVGSGFLPASAPPRTGPGVDPRCGSTLRRDCRSDGVLSQCEAVDTPLDDALTFLCH